MFNVLLLSYLHIKVMFTQKNIHLRSCIWLKFIFIKIFITLYTHSIYRSHIVEAQKTQYVHHNSIIKVIQTTRLMCKRTCRFRLQAKKKKCTYTKRFAFKDVMYSHTCDGRLTLYTIYSTDFTQ